MNHRGTETQRLIHITRLIAVAMALILGVSVLGAQSDGVTIHTPVSGDYAIVADEAIVIIDTSIGVDNGLINTIPAESYLIWNETGSKLLYHDKRYDLTWYDLSLQQTVPHSIGASDSTYNTLGWSLDSLNIWLLGISEIVEYPYHMVTYYEYDVTQESTNAISKLDAYTTHSDIPNLEGLSPYDFGSVRHAFRNPVYNNWIIADYYSQSYESNIIIHNLESEDMIQINAMFPNQSIIDYRWNKSGKQILVETQNLTTHEYSFNILNFSQDGSIAIKPSATSPTEDLLMGTWIGVDDIFIIRTVINGRRVYYLGQIIDGVLNSKMFFDLSATSYPTDYGDFYLRAGEQEKHELSCLFDQAQATQFSIGDRGWALTALSLYAEPDFASDELAQIPEGTEFDIIGGSACINADSYYRLWQIELDDGTIGWATEADLDGYFMAVSDDE